MSDISRRIIFYVNSSNKQQQVDSRKCNYKRRGSPISWDLRGETWSENANIYFHTSAESRVDREGERPETHNFSY